VVLVLLIVLLTLAANFGLDVVLGAVLAGLVLRRWTNRMGVDVEPLESKLEAVGYGVFIALLIYARVLPFRERVEMTFITATTMPLLIALAAIGLSDGVMLPSNAAALVGAGVVSVLVFPAVATVLRRRGRSELRSGRR
jgi:Kef-type K+ transport system membrane component KefB